MPWMHSLGDRLEETTLQTQRECERPAVGCKFRKRLGANAGTVRSKIDTARSVPLHKSTAAVAFVPAAVGGDLLPVPESSIDLAVFATSVLVA